MSKTTITYWNPLNPDKGAQWKPIDGLQGMADELTLSIDVGLWGRVLYYDILEMSFYLSSSSNQTLAVGQRTAKQH